MSEFYFYLLTRADMGVRRSVATFLQNWLRRGDDTVPQKYDSGEPIQKAFLNDDASPAVRLWIEGGIGLMFSRIRPRMTLQVNWTREFAPKVSTTLDAWMDASYSDGVVDSFFRFLVQSFEAEFALVTSAADFKEKHFVTFASKYGEASKFAGKETAATLPGIYWRTYISNDLVQGYSLTLGEEISTCSYERGVLIRPYEDSKLIGSREGRAIERRLMSGLGENAFFDKSAFSSTL